MRELEIRLRSSGGVLQRCSHRDLSGHIDRMVRTGRLTALLPGVYCTAPDATNPLVRLRAAALWGGPDAVLTGHAAAKLTFWPSSPLDQITLALPTQAKRSQAGFDVQLRRVPDRWISQHGRLRVTCASLTAVDLAAGPNGGDVIDRVLRTGQGSLDDMWAALSDHPRRHGNKQRAELLRDSRNEPWSEAERLQHRLLRRAGIGGWGTNRWVPVGDPGYVVDVLFEWERLVLEIDGWETHGTREAFESDRRRRNHLVLAGYRVLNFTWRQLVDQPEWILECVHSALGRR